MADIPLAEDLIEGAEAIGAEYGFGPKRAFGLMEAKEIPAFKIAGRWFARRSTIRKHIERLERGDVA
jgi:hypothetical protein